MNSLEQTNKINKLVYFMNNINFDEFKIKNDFIENHVKREFQSNWGVFNNVCWKDIIKYSLGSEFYQYYNIGKLFKANGIYDFIVSGISFNKLNDTNYMDLAESEHGILLFDIKQEIIYGYYKINMGGCPTCGLNMVYGYPYEVSLYISQDIEGIIKYCMTDAERTIANHYLLN